MNQEPVGNSRIQTKTAHNSQMDQDLFTYLPLEIILNILLRLPTQTLMSCKCVYKPWRDLLKTPEFVKSHLSKSVPDLVILLGKGDSVLYKVFELVDELNPMQCMRHLNRSSELYEVFEFEDELRVEFEEELNPPTQCVGNLNKIFAFNLPCGKIYSSVNGLFFSCTENWTCHAVQPHDLVISNPITCEYIELPRPPEFSSPKPQVNLFGFGLSRITGQYKVVQIFCEWIVEDVSVAPFKCQVYTVGTGSWRRISSAGLLKYKGNAKSVFLNGNLHWVVRDFKGSSACISCFDLESELFSTFSSPPPCHDNREEDLSVSSLKDSLCFCDNSAHDEIVIWLMNEYGDEKSWTKEFVIRRECVGHGGSIWPIKVFKSGDVLMEYEMYSELLYFSKKTETLCPVDLLKGRFCIWLMTYTPSFLPLKSFASENVVRL